MAWLCHLPDKFEDKLDKCEDKCIVNTSTINTIFSGYGDYTNNYWLFYASTHSVYLLRTSIDLEFLAQPTTTIPSCASLFAVSYPIPADAPVTIATLPFHLSIPG